MKLRLLLKLVPDKVLFIKALTLVITNLSFMGRTMNFVKAAKSTQNNGPRNSRDRSRDDQKTSDKKKICKFDKILREFSSEKAQRPSDFQIDLCAFPRSSSCSN